MTATLEWLFARQPAASANELRYRHRHAAWTEFITSGGHVAWFDGYVTPYMSAWCMYQRYCRLNVTTGSELLEPVNPRDCWEQPPRPRRSFLEPETWLPAPRRRDHVHDGRAFTGVLTSLRGAGLTHWAGQLTFTLADDDHIRLCPTCRTLGYQSAFAQIAGVARCPIHGLPYQTTCSQCGEPLPPFCFERRSKPTRCSHCQTFLLAPDQDIQELPLRFRQRECEAWSSLAAWLEALSGIVASRSSLVFPRRIEIGEPRIPQSRILWVLDAVRPLPYGLRPYLAEAPTTLRVMHIHGIKIPWKEGKDAPLTGAAAADRRRVLASIRHHVLRRYLHGHRMCLHAARRWLFIMSAENGIRYAPRLQDGCYTAQAFLYWICATKYRARHRSPSNLDPANILWPSAANSDLRVWAHQVLAAFHERFVAMRLAYHLEADVSSPHARMATSDPDVRDVTERLEFQDGGLYMASSVISLKDGETVVIGRGAHPELGGRSCPNCRVPT